jgi:hypothetical protein
MLALCPVVVVGFGAMALFPPATVWVSMGIDNTARQCQLAYRDHGKKQVSHSLPP